ncbi:hypothetical protein PENSTE_c001G06697 [Penicillium steckii]|uniref:mRNA export factor GLE1 n=1 Tax=Penicillium steckii TaxID=303698 RepID=A0A1V6TZ04_9EURO|nr:hypothetical protein PENSTE_c001G06697 [Penicillium steckii]
MTRPKIHVPPLDSPSKQLVLELARDFENVRLFNEDLKRVKEYEINAYQQDLDRVDREREAVHTAALDEAAAFHENIRQQAEKTLQEHIRVEEEERRRKEEAARREQERLERERAEKLRREQEEAARVEAERQAKLAAEKKAAEETERARKAAIEEKERKEREERERADAAKRKEAEAAQEAQKAKEEAERQAQAEKQSKIGAATLSPEEIQVHQRYLQLHKDLKEFRKWLIDDYSKQNPAFKKAAGVMRRNITKCVGQLRDGKGTNKKQTQDIKVELEQALAVREPTVDLRKFLVSPPESIAQAEQPVPALLIYGLHILSKKLISGLINEASVHPTHAEPIGIIAAQIFSMQNFMYNGIHMSDILWAKIRFVCPALWGFNGNPKTAAGRDALGWRREMGQHVSEQQHLDRMTAMGGGFAAITLRNFGKAQRQNPFPNTIFWTSIQKLLSIPVSDITDTHIMLIKSMLYNSGDRIIGFWGQFGVYILHRAIIDLPNSLSESMSVSQLKILRDIYRDERHIIF